MEPRRFRTASLLATCTLTFAVVVCASAARVGADAATLTVRVYNSASITPAEILAARAAADAILRDAGLNVMFRHCGWPVSADRPSDPCDTPLKPSEVVVRVIPAPPFSTSLHPEAYGLTYVVRDTNRGWLATVFSDRVDQAAARVGIDAGTLLGRVMAHEVGHLLLGTDYHGDSGVMRAEWPDAMLSRSAEAWRFSMREAARIQGALVQF